MNLSLEIEPASLPPRTNRKKILLGHLGSFGDCLYATTIARQIKHDFPGCHLTWAIGSMYSSIIYLNPYVDDTWEIPAAGVGEIVVEWPKFQREAIERKSRGDFDEIFLTQILPGNLRNYDGTIRSSTFRNYPGKITVPTTPVLRLSATEVENVRRFAAERRLSEKKSVILFECVPRSGQSSANLEFALEAAKQVISLLPNVCVILSSHLSFASNDDRIIDGSVLSFRENAELTKHCTLLVGSSSGISWLCTSDWAKRLPMIQLIKPDAFCFASLVYDHEYFGLPHDSIIEMKGSDPGRLTRCVVSAVEDGFVEAKSTFHQKIKMSYRYYEDSQFELLRHWKLKEGFRFLLFHLRRHGFHLRFVLWPFFRVFEKLVRRFA